MTQLTRHPAYALIEDKLDAIGQKYRALRIIRGLLLFAACALAATLVASLGASFAGAGKIAYGLFGLWAVWLVATAILWIIRPLLIKPQAVQVARMVESRISKLHNGLTNSVLLARSTDLHNSPWLEPIFEEVLSTVREKPIGQAFSLRDVKKIGIWTAAVLFLTITLICIPPVRNRMNQGWQQMFNPTRFVAKQGRVKIKDCSPKSITLVLGQPLEITVIADDPDKSLPPGRLIIENSKNPKPELLTPFITPEDELRYAYRINHVEEPMRWRVEIGDSQSEWCDVKIVKQVKLQELALTITPPPYTNKPRHPIVLKPEDIDKTPVTVLEGSRVEFSSLIDIPVKSAMLQLDQDTTVPMDADGARQRFTASVIVMRNSELACLLTEGGQVIAKVPDPAIRIGCTRDAAPTIDMKWPAQDTAAAPKSEIKLQAIVKDDLGLSGVRVLMSTGPDQPLALVVEKPCAGQTTLELIHVLSVPDNLRVHGQSIRVQIEAIDNRNLAGLSGPGVPAGTSSKDTGPQTTQSPIYEIKFRDPEEIAREQKEQFDKLRQLLQELLKKQQALLALSQQWTPDLATMPQIHKGQVDLRAQMQQVAQTFPFEPDDKIIQKMLLVLIQNPAKEAVDLAAGIPAEKLEKEQRKLNKDLQTKQRRIIEVLESMISKLNVAAAPTTQATKKGSDLENDKEKWKDLQETLKKFMAEEKRILDATATLAKKPVDNFDDNDKKLAEELKMAQEKLDAFMQEKITDFSKLAEQDMANASLLKEMMEVYSEVTMAKDALKKQAAEIAVPAEEMGLEKAAEISSNLEKWLMNEPDRQKWNQEDPLDKNDIPMAELPKELEDMVGELMEQQEDLFEEMEDTAANWADSLDKGAGWDAADGPIASMSAKGVTGNQLPNNNEMNGRSGEGRSGKSSGEFVEETASGKGGRNTPTRLDQTPFQQGQIKDESKDPVGGATGGGKMSGQGGQGLEGPVPPKDVRDKMERLATKQAELRNKAERLHLDQKVGRYDNFKLMESVAIMRRVESDLRANRYQTAMRRKEMTLDKLEASHLLLGGQIHLQKDTSPQMGEKMQDQINDVLNGKLPPGWSEPLKEYYKKLSQQ